jgi:hypothetical protein
MATTPVEITNDDGMFTPVPFVAPDDTALWALELARALTESPGGTEHVLMPAAVPLSSFLAPVVLVLASASQRASGIYYLVWVVVCQPQRTLKTPADGQGDGFVQPGSLRTENSVREHSRAILEGGARPLFGEIRQSFGLPHHIAGRVLTTRLGLDITRRH